MKQDWLVIFICLLFFNLYRECLEKHTQTIYWVDEVNMYKNEYVIY